MIKILFFIHLFLSSCSTVEHRVKEASLASQTWLRPGILNSTRIEEKFGSYGVQILKQDNAQHIRLASLYSLDKGKKISRTIALSKFADNIEPGLLEVHKEILAGGSIGASIKKHGFNLKKEVFFKGQIRETSPQLRQLMQTGAYHFAVVAYDLWVENHGKNTFYCTITEVYSPAFIGSNELDLLYPETISSSVAKLSRNIELIKANL